MRGRKRKVSHARVVAYWKKHPEVTQDELASRFRLSQSQISNILREAGYEGEKRRGKAPKRQPWHTNAEYQWELKLHKLGLGMERGSKLGGHRLLTDEDALKDRMEPRD